MSLISQKEIRSNMINDPEHRVMKEAMLKDCVLTDKELTLASGRKSRFYVDCRVAACHPGLGEMAGSLMQKCAASILTHNTVWSDWVFAPVPMGGILLLGRMMDKASYHMRNVQWAIPRPERKGHGRKQLVEGIVSAQRTKLVTDQRVLVIEDVVTSGGSSLKAVAALREEGLRVEGVLALVDRQEGAQELFEENKLALWSVFQKSSFKSS